MSLVEWTALLLGLATALATSITAYAVWHQWRGAIQVEWEPVWNTMYEKSFPPHLQIRITVRNNRNYAIKVSRAEVSRCPVKDVTQGPNTQKNESWQSHQVPLDMDVEPGASKSRAVFVYPDWESLAARRLVKWQPNSSTALRIQISIASKARNRKRMKHHTTIDIPNEMIAEAATVART